MRRIIPIVVLTCAVFLPSQAAATCGPVWLNTPPTSTYKDAPLRLHFNPDRTKCSISFDQMDGQTISVTLGGETEPTLFKVKNIINTADFIQDLTPINTWGNRSTVSFPLGQISADCYPTDTGNPEVLSFTIDQKAAPSAGALKATIKDIALRPEEGQYYLELEVDPADPQFIYWVTISPTDQKSELPSMISNYSPITQKASSGKSIFLALAVKGQPTYETCQAVFNLVSCTEYSMTVVAEDLLGRRSAVSDPIPVTIGTSPDGSYWKFGDPLNCGGGGSGCSCSNVGLSGSLMN